MTESGPRHIPWDDLDALALEEEEAVRAEAAASPARGSPFSSDEEFLVRALAHLAAHPAPAALLARLSEGFAPQPEPATASAAPPPAAGPEEPRS